MSIPNLANGWQSVLSAGITNAETSVDVVSTSGMPARPFRAIIAAEGANTDEIITVTGLTGSSITFTRASEAISDGTQVASAHGSGATITHVLTKQTLLDLTVGPVLGISAVNAYERFV